MPFVQGFSRSLLGVSDIQKWIADGERADALTISHVLGVEGVAVQFQRAKYIHDGIDSWVNPHYSAIMNARLTIDKAGRIVIPKPLREELHLEPGDDLELESAGEEITLRPVRGRDRLRKSTASGYFAPASLCQRRAHRNAAADSPGS